MNETGSPGSFRSRAVPEFVNLSILLRRNVEKSAMLRRHESEPSSEFQTSLL